MNFLKNIDVDNTMLLNIIYHPPKKENAWHDYLDVVYKDLRSGDKRVKTIEDPEVEIYFTKDEFCNYDYNKAFIPLIEAEKVVCKYKDLLMVIAKKAGSEYVNFVKGCYERRARYEAKNVHKYPYVFGSDYDIENLYRIWYNLHYHSTSRKPVTKMFLDIEVDTINCDGFPEDGEHPINVITIIDELEMTSYTFFLRNPKNPLIQDFEDNIKDFKLELADAFDESYGKISYKFYAYNDESELLIDVFKLINTLKRDFLLIWHLSFDIPYIIARLYRLGLEPIDVMCSKDFKIQDMFFYTDTKNYKVSNKGDYFRLSSYTVYLDQMVTYAALRKGRSELRSHRLTYVAQVEIKDEKLDFSEESNLKTLPYVNYKKFLMYNIKDTLLQLGIETKTKDVETVYLRSYSNVTGYNKIFRQSIVLKNRAYLEYFKNGYIIGNNANVTYGATIEKEPEDTDDDDTNDTTFDGAVVGDPLLNECTGIKLFGKRSQFIFDNVADQDFSSMYPNMITTFNIAPNTLVGKLIIDRDIIDIYNKYLENPIETTEDKGAEFIDNLLTKNYGLIGTKWFNLPTIEILIDKLNAQTLKKNKKIFKIDRSDVDAYFIDKVNI